MPCVHATAGQAIPPTQTLPHARPTCPVVAACGGAPADPFLALVTAPPPPPPLTAPPPLSPAMLGMILLNQCGFFCLSDCPGDTGCKAEPAPPPSRRIPCCPSA
eukprot:1157574-Pelagomonas_calceolata.AAC.16